MVSANGGIDTVGQMTSHMWNALLRTYCAQNVFQLNCRHFGATLGAYVSSIQGLKSGHKCRSGTGSLLPLKHTEQILLGLCSVVHTKRATWFS